MSIPADNKKLKRKFSNELLYRFNLTNNINLVMPSIKVQIRPMNIFDMITNLVLSRKISELRKFSKSILKWLLKREVVYNSIYNHRIVSRGIVDIGGPRINRKKYEFAIVDCETDPIYRGNRLYPATITRILADYKTKGYKTAYMWTYRYNLTSQKGIEHAGFKRVNDRKLFSRLFLSNR